eukprot:CAMPEP_0198296556 /NCGR_PEP_ID=MMETSP1449-20131203/33044_1 /TAXON_ID=420275 /ORGANISM="Attheya septentrionalis, Strain CCMP2084" /LENGTH=177 /DNA_ID=CAMNT_0043997205 /DNA_START=86 /DNA_END=619 /DNA_ORIENTATION=+
MWDTKLLLLAAAFLFSSAAAWVPQGVALNLPTKTRGTGRAGLHYPFEVQSSSRHQKSHLIALRLKWKESDPEQEEGLKLTEEEDGALREAGRDLDPTFGPRWFDKADAWDTARKSHPVLEPYSDDELRMAFIRQSPKFADVLLYTPLGPFLLINLVIYITGFSWCNTPFHFANACPS